MTVLWICIVGVPWYSETFQKHISNGAATFLTIAEGSKTCRFLSESFFFFFLCLDCAQINLDLECLDNDVR